MYKINELVESHEIRACLKFNGGRPRKVCGSLGEIKKNGIHISSSDQFVRTLRIFGKMHEKFSRTCIGITSHRPHNDDKPFEAIAFVFNTVLVLHPSH